MNQIVNWQTPEGVHERLPAHVSLQVAVQCVWVERGWGRATAWSARKLLERWSSALPPAFFRPWHESTKQQHVLARGLSKHQRGNRCNVQQRATQGRARCKRDVWNADTRNPPISLWSIKNYLTLVFYSVRFIKSLVRQRSGSVRFSPAKRDSVSPHKRS